jgi:hypothetical protein
MVVAVDNWGSDIGDHHLVPGLVNVYSLRTGKSPFGIGKATNYSEPFSIANC